MNLTEHEIEFILILLEKSVDLIPKPHPELIKSIKEKLSPYLDVD